MADAEVEDPADTTKRVSAEIAYLQGQIPTIEKALIDTSLKETKAYITSKQDSDPMLNPTANDDYKKAAGGGCLVM